MIFDKSYTDYWMRTVNGSIDGTIIPGNEHAWHFLSKLKMKNFEKDSVILDVGCSFGRMFDTLYRLSSNIYGVDCDYYATSLAKRKPYIGVVDAPGEETGLPNNFAHLTFAWLVFDVLDQARFLQEASRITKVGGLLICTATNDSYCEDDVLAFKAEKNAYLKQFPKSFTNTFILNELLSELGFTMEVAWTFKRRGDFGKLKYSEHLNSNGFNNHYELLFVARKLQSAQVNIPRYAGQLSKRFSDTSLAIAKKLGYLDSYALFRSIGID